MVPVQSLLADVRDFSNSVHKDVARVCGKFAVRCESNANQIGDAAFIEPLYSRPRINLLATYEAHFQPESIEGSQPG